jgi:glycosyltransferase involved in cell wall biosynthesis
LVNLDKYKPSKVFVMLQVGTVCANKNQAFTLRVLQLARDRGLGHDWELWLAFDEMLDSSVATLIEELELVHCVKLLGWRNDVPDLMCEADLLLHPSISEGIPNVVQESMYLGLPVVASDAGGLPEIIANDRNGWIIDTDQPEAWADRITWCRNHPEQRRKVGEEAAKHARAHFNSEEWAAAYSRVFMGEV